MAMLVAFSVTCQTPVLSSRTRPPRSIRLRTTSSTKKGFPSALARIASRVWLGRSCTWTRLRTRTALSSGERGRQVDLGQTVGVVRPMRAVQPRECGVLLGAGDRDRRRWAPPA